jgi:hypothetical protein
MTANLDIYRTANVLVKEYGAEQAPLMAASRADALLYRGDVDGQRVWKAVAAGRAGVDPAQSKAGRAGELTRSSRKQVTAAASQPMQSIPNWSLDH